MASKVKCIEDREGKILRGEIGSEKREGRGKGEQE